MTIPSAVPTVLLVLSALCPVLDCRAQASGARGGVASEASFSAPELDAFAVEHYITIEGKAEIRVEPSELRIVLAVVTEADSAQSCQQRNRQQLEGLITAWTEGGTPREAISVDFISLLPLYEWKIGEQAGRQVASEVLSGFRLQNNVHLTVPDEARARIAVGAAFEAGVTDVIAVDYWSRELEEKRNQALQRALEVAKRKADVLLGAAFEKRPKPINVRETTRTIYPKDLYRSFENVYAQSIDFRNWRQELPRISASRPKNTYYHGFFDDADVHDPTLPSRPQISVVSTVRLYFAAPDRPAPVDKR